MENIYNINLNEINDTKSLKALQNKLNEAFDKRLVALQKDEFGKQLSESSFGYIKKCFEEFVPFLFENKEGQKLMGKYIKTIKENKNLSTLYNIYEGIRRTGKDSDVDYFISALSSSEKEINKKTIKEDVKKLGDILNTAYHLVCESKNTLMIPTNNDKLDAAVEYLVEHKSTTQNLSEYSVAVKAIREDIESRETSLPLKVKRSNVDNTFDVMVEQFNEKYNDLSEAEISIVNEILSAKDPQVVFDKYINECLDAIDKKRTYFKKIEDIASKKRLDGVYEQISKKEYSKETLSEDIDNILQLTELFG